mgnify:CR=1 FL=1
MDTTSYTTLDSARGDEQRSRSDLAYDSIKRRLLSGDFPLASRLAEERLAKELDVSRTPVREALSRLFTEGLIDRHPEGGYEPALPDLEQIAELYEVRASLEQTALHRPPDDVAVAEDALASLRDDWLLLADDEAARQPDPSFVLFDEDFHVRLAMATGNRELATMLTAVNERIRVVRMHDFLSADRIDATIDQHLGILDAALRRRLGEASTALEDHLDESARHVQGRAAEAIANMIRNTKGRR